MTITRLERKSLRNISKAKRKKQIIKSLCKIPVIKNVDIKAIKEEFKLKKKQNVSQEINKTKKLLKDKVLEEKKDLKKSKSKKKVTNTKK